MALDSNIRGSTSGNGLEVDASNRALVRLPDATTPANVGGVRFFSENDAGEISGTPNLLSPETDVDYRLRVSQETLLDNETFNYTAQNTGKFSYANTTATITWNTGGLLTNASSITTTTTGVSFGSYAMFPMLGSTEVYCEILGSFSAPPVANTIIDYGMFQRGGANPYTPTDGVYFRLTSAGLFGVINHNGTETATSVFDFPYTNSQVYQFLISFHEREVRFWIDDVLYGTIITPVGQGQPFMSAALPFSLRHAITGGAAGGVLQFTVRDYVISVGGLLTSSSVSTIGNRLFGAYQGLSGGTMGSLANYANSANPTAAVPTNTTAALGTGLGGQFWETVSLAVNTDGIICSYQVPAGTVSVAGKRLVIRGIGLMSYVQTVIVGGPYVAQYSLAFGHTAVSLATTEAAATKAPRRIPLAGLTQLVTAAQAVSTMVSQPGGSFIDFGDAPIYVNPGEFVALVTKHVGTVGSTGTVAHVVTFVYGWE
jgi:hypothetical protein